jgi:hypothetical protein
MDTRDKISLIVAAILLVLISAVITFHLMDGPKKLLEHSLIPPPATERNHR